MGEVCCYEHKEGILLADSLCCLQTEERKGQVASLVPYKNAFVLRGWQCIGCCEDGNALDVVSITDIVTQQASVVGLHACAPSCLPRQCSCFK